MYRRVVLQQALADLNTAYRNFFASKSGKRKGRAINPPRFRSRRDNSQSIRFAGSAQRVTQDGRLALAKIGHVKVRWSRQLPADPSTVTIIKDASGRYFASFVVEVPDVTDAPTTNMAIGVDLGLNHFAVFSDGRKIDNPRFFRHAERRLKHYQRALSRKQKGSANRDKARLKVAKAHAKVADARRDFHHKLSTQIIRENQAVYVEDLCVSGLGRTNLAKSVHDVGWSSFVAMLDYKAKRYGRAFVKVDRWAPTSQMCSECGHKDGKKPLNVREWTCPQCESIHDRDVNAAKNILALGHRATACGEDVRPAQLAADLVEAGTHRGAA